MYTRHLRESRRTWKMDQYNGAKTMMNLLLEASRMIGEAGGQLALKDSKKYRIRKEHKVTHVSRAIAV